MLYTWLMALYYCNLCAIGIVMNYLIGRGYPVHTFIYGWLILVCFCKICVMQLDVAQMFKIRTHTFCLEGLHMLLLEGFSTSLLFA